MLVLTRKRSEMIQIGDQIVVTVLRTGRSTVKIGIEAPGNVRVFRGELCPEAGGTTLKSLLEQRHLRRLNGATVNAAEDAPATPVHAPLFASHDPAIV